MLSFSKRKKIIHVEFSLMNVHKCKYQSEEMLWDISKTLEPITPMCKRQNILDKIENPTHGDCERCKIIL